MGSFLHYKVQSLCNQLLFQFLLDHSQTLHTFCGHNKDMDVGF